MVAGSSFTETGRPQVRQGGLAGSGPSGLAMSSPGQLSQPAVDAVWLKSGMYHRHCYTQTDTSVDVNLGSDGELL